MLVSHFLPAAVPFEKKWKFSGVSVVFSLPYSEKKKIIKNERKMLSHKSKWTQFGAEAECLLKWKVS